jgi:hypothetical protein
MRDIRGSVRTRFIRRPGCPRMLSYFAVAVLPRPAAMGRVGAPPERRDSVGSDRSVTPPSLGCWHPVEPLEHAGDALLAVGRLVIGATLYCSATAIPGGSPVGRTTRVMCDCSDTENGTGHA